jgi:hypothetical protein
VVGVKVGIGPYLDCPFSLVPSMVLKVLIFMGVIKFLWCGGGELVIKLRIVGFSIFMM